MAFLKALREFAHAARATSRVSWFLVGIFGLTMIVRDCLCVFLGFASLASFNFPHS